MSRFVWTSAQFAALASAEVRVYVVADMPSNRIVMETVDDERAKPLCIVAGNRRSFHVAESEAYRRWGPDSAAVLVRRIGRIKELELLGGALRIPILESPATVGIAAAGIPPMPREWRIDL